MFPPHFQNKKYIKTGSVGRISFSTYDHGRLELFKMTMLVSSGRISFSAGGPPCPRSIKISKKVTARAHVTLCLQFLLMNILESTQHTGAPPPVATLVMSTQSIFKNSDDVICPEVCPVVRPKPLLIVTFYFQKGEAGDSPPSFPHFQIEKCTKTESVGRISFSTYDRGRLGLLKMTTPMSSGRISFSAGGPPLSSIDATFEKGHCPVPRHFCISIAPREHTRVDQTSRSSTSRGHVDHCQLCHGTQYIFLKWWGMMITYIVCYLR